MITFISKSVLEKVPGWLYLQAKTLYANETFETNPELEFFGSQFTLLLSIFMIYFHLFLLLAALMHLGSRVSELSSYVR